MKRKPIQISVTGVTNSNQTQCNYIRTVICDDGTIWENNDERPEWYEVKPIPQPKKDT